MSVTIREQTENQELACLSPYATPSARSAGRKKTSEKCPVRTEFQKDRDKITHCKAFRRLMHKTQVFISPEGDHYRTRLTHTLEVAQVARTIARALRLNEDLTEAIALGHDLGHTPFGHTGEDAIDAISPWDFHHNEQSVRVVESLERGGEGLNLTAEVIDGILNHPTRCMPKTMEGQVVRISDKIAYINHDIDDAIRAGILTDEDLPRDCTEILGTSGSGRIDFLIGDAIAASIDTDEIRLHEHVGEAMSRLREFLYKNVYSCGLHTNERKKIQRMLTDLFEYYLMYTEKLPGEFIEMISAGEDERRVVIDFVAGMTDRYALRVYKNIFMPLAWNV